MLSWLVVLTKPRTEALAEGHLERQGFEVLCPLMRVQKQRRFKWTWVEEPLFPRYLFVGAKPEQSWAPLRSTVGVVSPVKFGGIYATVPQTLIDLLRSRAEERQEHRPLFMQGQKLRIVTGPYASLDAVFEMQDGSDRALVLLDLLGRQNRVSVNVSQLIVGDR
ncbi:MAG: transcription/translation regulatory transformer protein RfaH [Gammaproteobacteria bacterium]|nr:transcription/translation regulatory transformer protein RfaH [Gammaproteobacteria bacterium]